MQKPVALFVSDVVDVDVVVAGVEACDSGGEFYCVPVMMCSV